MSGVFAHAAIRLCARDDAEHAPDRRSGHDPVAVSAYGFDRRIHPRLTSQELEWLHEARMKYGPAVRLIDVSAGGALFETQARVCPNSDVVLHLVGQDLDLAVPSRVLRSQISALGEGPRYRGACVFRRALDVCHLLVPASKRKDPLGVDYLKAEFALKSIVDHYIECETGNALHSPADVRGMLDGLRVLQAAAERRSDPGDRKLAELVAGVLRALEGAESIGSALAAIDTHLRQVMPLVAIRVMGAPAAASDGAESIYFDITASRRMPPGVLNVEFPAGFAPDSTQFRLLKASAYLITLLRDFHMRGEGPAASSRGTTPRGGHAPAGAPTTQPAVAAALASPAVAGGQGERVALVAAATTASSATAVASRAAEWHPVVVRFVDGRLLRGYTSDFHAARSQLHLSPSPGATGDCLLVPLAAAKAVFFVKDLVGDPMRLDRAAPERASNGRRIEVTFNDGEVVRGSTLNYDPARQGFFLTPADATGNNARVFVISAAVRHVRFPPPA